MAGHPDKVFPIFFAVWVCLALFSLAFFFLNNNAKLKRRVLPPFAVFAGLLFLGFTWLMGFPWPVFIIGVPSVAWITVLNMRNIKFCDACGRTTFSRNSWSPPQSCSRCGAPLDKPAE